MSDSGSGSASGGKWTCNVRLRLSVSQWAKVDWQCPSRLTFDMLTYDMSTYEPAKASNFVENGTVPRVDFKCLSLNSRSREVFWKI